MNKVWVIVLVVLVLCVNVGMLSAEPNPDLPPVIGPYLQNPGESGMTVCLAAKDAGSVLVALKKAGSEDERIFTAEPHRIPDTEWTIWKARLENLQNAEYEYTVRYNRLNKSQSTKSCRFRTPIADEKSVNAAIFNDIHGRVATLEALMQHCDPNDYDFSILLGDCWNDPKSVDQALYLLDRYINLLNAGEKPMLFVRGNHEYRGAFAHDLAYLFDLPYLDASQPTGKQYFNFTLTTGPVWFLVMDCGEDFEKMNDVMMPYRQYQAQWLEALLKNKAGENAPWRVFISHIPLYNKNIWNSEPSRQTWEPLLVNADMDLALAAHDHSFKTLQAGQTFKVTHDPKYTENRGEWEMIPPFPVIIGGGPELERGTVRLLNADPDEIRVRTIMAKDGSVGQEFVLSEK